MLYTFSQVQYHQSELARYFEQIKPQDAILLWQDAILLPLKHPQYFQQLNTNCYALELDISARGLSHQYHNSNIQSISLQQLVKLSEQYYPQFAL